MTPSDLSSAPLPVDLLFFTGKTDGSKATLTWATASELNNDFFEIEKSDNGLDFHTIGRHEGNGTSKNLITYSFVDYSFVKHSFYRLKQVDYDGTQEYREVISVKNNSLSADIVTQTDNELVVSPSETAQLLMVNQTGHVLLNQVITQETTLKKAHFPSGIYVLRVNTPSGLKTVKWVNMQ